MYYTGDALLPDNHEKLSISGVCGCKWELVMDLKLGLYSIRYVH